MAVPWLRIIDTVLGLTDVALKKRLGRAEAAVGDREQLAPGGPVTGALEARLAGVVVAALKEAFDRDHQRLELEREQIEAERQRADRALRLELLRQAGDREIGRLRLIAGVAVASWLGTLFFSMRLIGGPVGARSALAAGWLLLLGALAAAFVAQSRVGAGLATADDRTQVSALSGAAGGLAPWLIVTGLAIIGLAVLLA